MATGIPEGVSSTIPLMSDTMESLVGLDCYDAELREYLSKHKYPTIIEVCGNYCVDL